MEHILIQHGGGAGVSFTSSDDGLLHAVLAQKTQSSEACCCTGSQLLHFFKHGSVDCFCLSTLQSYTFSGSATAPHDIVVAVRGPMAAINRIAYQMQWPSRLNYLHVRVNVFKYVSCVINVQIPKKCMSRLFNLLLSYVV